LPKELKDIFSSNYHTSPFYCFLKERSPNQPSHSSPLASNSTGNHQASNSNFLYCNTTDPSERNFISIQKMNNNVDQYTDVGGLRGDRVGGLGCKDAGMLGCGGAGLKVAWSAEEDNLLRKLVCEFGGPNHVKSWKRLCDYFEDRTELQLVQRWQRLNSLRINSRSEDDYVRKLINKFGLGNWNKIARYLPPNVAEQYKERLSAFYKFDDNNLPTQKIQEPKPRPDAAKTPNSQEAQILNKINDQLNNNKAQNPSKETQSDSRYIKWNQDNDIALLEAYKMYKNSKITKT
jgi:hypothetical protein